MASFETQLYDPPLEVKKIQRNLPFAVIDYCNNCRSATGAIIPHGSVHLQ